MKKQDIPIDSFFLDSETSILPADETIKPVCRSVTGKTKLRVRYRSVIIAGEHAEGGADYELSQEIGKGGMAVVFEGHQSALDRQVAIKMIRPERKDNEEQRAKFLYEAAVTSDLEHPNIVPVHDLGTAEDGQPFYVMKRVHGTPWNNVIREKSLAENLHILLEVANAVAFAHSRGVIHRDLKQHNVMIGDY